MGGNPNLMGPRPPLGPGVQGPVPGGPGQMNPGPVPPGPGGPQPQQQNQQPNQQNQPQGVGMGHPSISQQQASRLSILEQERQQNLVF